MFWGGWQGIHQRDTPYSAATAETARNRERVKGIYKDNTLQAQTLPRDLYNSLETEQSTSPALPRVSPHKPGPRLQTGWSCRGGVGNVTVFPSTSAPE